MDIAAQPNYSFLSSYPHLLLYLYSLIQMFSRNNATVQTITPAIHSAVDIWQGRQDAMGKLLWVLLPLLLYLYTFQSSCMFLPSHQVHLSTAKWKAGFSYFLWTRGLFQDPANTNTSLFFFLKKKDKMCSPGCHYLPDKIPGTPGKLLIHASYSLLGMCLEHVFEINLVFLFRTLTFSQVKQGN